MWLYTDFRVSGDPIVERTKPNLHIAFNLSAAGTVRQALRSMHSEERVIGFIDNLSFGPIDSPSVESRVKWVENVVGFDWLEVVQRAELFWSDATSQDISATVWVCFDDAAEYCGFLELVWRFGDAAFNVIDATGLEFTDHLDRKWTPRSLGIISAERLIEAGLVGRALPARPDAIDGYRKLWSRLRNENAPLRIVGTTGLTSAPITYFDHWLTSYATDEWSKGHQLVGEVMGQICQSEGSPHVSDIWLWGRVCALGEEGDLEVTGDTSDMRSTLVRRRTSAPKTASS